MQEELEELRQRVHTLQSTQVAAEEGAAALEALKQQVSDLSAANRVLDEENDRIEAEKLELEADLEAAKAEAVARSAAADAAEAREKEARDAAEAVTGAKVLLQGDLEYLQVQHEGLQTASAEVWC